MNVYPERRNMWSRNAAQLSEQIMNLPYKELNESLRQKPEGLTNSTYNMFRLIGSACNTCICKICEYLKGQTMSTSAICCDCKPCNCKECTGSGNYFETANIELRLRYKNKFRNELDRVKTKSKGIPIGSVNCCQDRTRSCSYMQSQREECKQNTFRRSTVTVAPVEESRSPENCRGAPCSCNHCSQRGLTIPSNQTHEMSTGINRRANCQCENCLDNSCQPAINDACKCSMRRGVFRKPTEKYIQDYDIRSATVENQPLIIKRKRPLRHDPVSYHDTLPCISSTYHCRNKNVGTSQMKLYSTSKTLEPKSTDLESCKCTHCVCLACSFPKQTLYNTDSMESFRTCIMCNHTGNKWKGSRSKFDERGRATQVPKKGSIKVVEDSRNIIITAERSPGEKTCHGVGTGHGTPARLCQCNKQNNLIHKTHFNEMLDNVYSDLKIEEHEKNSNKFSTANVNGQQIHRNYEVSTLVNSETNTENHIANKCIETDSYPTDKKRCTSNKVKNYEYTLRIEIQTPNLNETKEATKQRIKKDTKKGVKEQTKRVVRELFSDISKNSLFSENLPENPKAYADEQDLKTMESSEHNKVRSILKQNSTTSKTGEAPSSLIRSVSTSELPVSTNSKGTTLEDCFFVRCLPSLQHPMSQMTEKVIEVSKTKIPLKDDHTESLTIKEHCTRSIPMENEWKQIFPATAKVTTKTPVNSLEKLNSTMNLEAVAVRDLDELRVQDPCVRRVSDHTVSLKWKQPKVMKDVMGFEILINGKTIEKILNPTRCLVVVSCLPPVGRILITIRTITKSPGLPGIIPCTTIGYRPRANKTICI